MKFWKKKKLERLVRKYFDGELSPFEERKLEFLLERDPEAKQLFDKMKQLDNALKLLKLKKRPPEIDVEKIARPRFRVRRVKSSALLISSIAAVIVIVLTSIVLYTRTVSRYGRPQVVRLEEGTEGYIRKVFRINIPGAREVSVVGDFNGWNPYVTPMKDVTGNGDWYVEVNVPEGAHHYMFLVDGRILVPDASAGVFLPDGYGGTDSVLIALERK